MDARDFVKVTVSSLSLRFLDADPPVLPSATSYFCRIKLHDFPVQTAEVPLIVPESTSQPTPVSRRNRTSRSNSCNCRQGAVNLNSTAASFYLEKPALSRLLHLNCLRTSGAHLEIAVFSECQGITCGKPGEKQLGNVKLKVTPEWAEARLLEVYHGWTGFGKRKTDDSSSYTPELHLHVKVEPDPRFVFQFDGEPALSSQIVQTVGNSKQPIFSCKFSRDRGSRGGLDDAFKRWTISSNSEKERERKERKGWLVMIHDLSGSPVAAASMVTPFVPSPGSNHVSRSNPGAWLILRPDPSGVSSWCPWGRLEAWREQGVKCGLGCRFQLVPGGWGVTGVNDGILISETVISAKRGGEFSIDTAKTHPSPLSPFVSPQSSGDFTINMALSGLNGFVMSCHVQGKGRSNKNRMKPEVQVAVRHISCLEDAAVFVALAAAVDLSMDACESFTRKLRKELSDAASSS